MLTFDAERGLEIPTIKINIDYYNENIGHILLIPHSVELYEVHISSLKFNEDFSNIKSIREAINVYGEAIQFGFSYMDKLQKIIAMIPLSNRFALFASKNIGMSLEGTIKKGHLFQGKMIDIEMYGLSRGDILCL
jgi:hypothetical protein